MDKIAVLIPCYNEAQTIAKVVRFLEENDLASLDLQIPADDVEQRLAHILLRRAGLAARRRDNRAPARRSADNPHGKTPAPSVKTPCILSLCIISEKAGQINPASPDQTSSFFLCSSFW